MTPILPSSLLRFPIAHRGLHDASDGRPENSRAAFQAAYRQGYGIELDLQLSADGEAMVFHDYDLDRLTDASGVVRQMSAADLGQIKLKGTDEGIPTLQEVLDLVAGRAALLIELKDQDGALGPDVGALEARTAELLSAYVGDLAVMSFNPHSVAHMAALAPTRPRGLVTDSFDPEVWPVPADRLDAVRAIEDLEPIGGTFISHAASDLASPRVAELKAAGCRILTWTIRSPEEEDAAREVAENITFEGYLAPHGA